MGSIMGMLGLSWVKLIALAAVAMIVGAGYLYVKTLHNDNERLIHANAGFKIAVELQKATIADAREAVTEWEESYEGLQREHDRIAQVERSARGAVDRLRSIFSKHDLEMLARNKPGLIQNRVNSGADRLDRLFECASGRDRPDCDRAGDETAPGGATP